MTKNKSEKEAQGEVLIGSFSIASALGLEPCQEKNCELPAIDGKSKCWQHLTEEERANVRKSVQDNRSNLRKIILPFADLSKLDLSEADLNLAILHGANLSECRLNNAKLMRAILTNCNLERADLSHAKCNSINLSEAIANEANFERAVLASCYAYNASFRKCNFSGALMHKADLNSSELQEAILEGAKLEDANLKLTNLSYANLRSANLRFAQISMANLSYADISNAQVFGISPWDCDTTGLVANNLIKGIENYSGLLPTFLTSTRKAPYILRLVVKSDYSQISNLAIILSHAEGLFSASEIWKDKQAPQLYISSVDEGSIDIKIITDLITDSLSLVNVGVLSTTLYYALGIGITTRIIREGLELYVSAKKSLLDIDQKRLDIQNNELDLERKKLDLEKKRLKLIVDQASKSKEVHEILASIEEQGFQLETQQKNTALALANKQVKKVFNKTTEQAFREFVGLKLCEANIISEGANKVLVITVDEKGNIHQANISELQFDIHTKKAK